MRIISRCLEVSLSFPFCLVDKNCTMLVSASSIYTRTRVEASPHSRILPHFYLVRSRTLLRLSSAGSPRPEGVINPLRKTTVSHNFTSRSSYHFISIKDRYLLRSFSQSMKVLRRFSRQNEKR